jgi:hypothetical protein
MYRIEDDGSLVPVQPSEIKLAHLSEEQERYLEATDDRALVFRSLPVPGPTMPASVRRLFGFGRHDLIQPGAPVQMGHAPGPQG